MGMNRSVWLQLLALVGCIMSLTACSGKEKDHLSVYVVESEKLYTTMVERFAGEEDCPVSELEVVTFETYEEMKTRMDPEIMRGKGPDVILLNAYEGVVDPYRLVSGNMLLPLDEKTAELLEEDYFTDIIRGGKIAGKQYYLPLGWNILQVYAGADAMKEKGYGKEIYYDFIREAEEVSESDTDVVTSLGVHRGDYLNMFSENLGIGLFDAVGGKLTDSESQTEEIARFVKMVVYDNMDKLYQLPFERGYPFSADADHTFFMLEDFPFMNSLRYYQSVYSNYLNQKMYFTGFVKEDSGMTAQVVQYGAINANTENESAAWELLKYILDAPAGNLTFKKFDKYNYYYAPLNRNSYEECVLQLGASSGFGPGKPVSALNIDNMQVLREIPEQISRTVIPNQVYGEIVRECMEPYMNGENSFEKCYEELLQRTDMYLDE